ncbi:MAG TPA: condensation domain-containing protein, partial [Gammaproteobacteria bacterium]
KVPAVVFQPPEGDVEERLARIWSEVLNVEQVGRDDNFFALGGHSLKALLAISKTRKAFDVDVGPRALFQSPTLAGFASLLTGVRRDGFESIEPAGEQDRYEVTPAQFRLWLQHELHPRSSAHNLSSAIELSEGLESAVIHWVLSRLVERHEALRTVFEREADAVYQRVLPPFEVELPESRWESDAELMESIRRHAVEPFDLIRGPLFRARLLHGQDGRRVLLWCMHEIVADGSSSVILRREINQLIKAHHGDVAPPQAPRIQYKDFAVWQRRQLAAENNAARVYWHRQLSGAITALDLPFDYPLTGESNWKADVYEHRLQADLKTRLDDLARSRQVTLFMLLQSALSTLLMRLTGQHDIILAVPVAGREHPDVQSTVGFFLNTILLRHRVESERTFTDLLEQVRRTTLEGLEQQHYPFERLLEELDLPHDPNRFPVTPVMFNMLNFIDSRDSSSGPGLARNRRFRDGKTEFEMDALDAGEDLRLRVFYRSALFKASTIEYLVGELEVLLEQIVEDSDKALAEYDLFGFCEVSGESYPQALNSAYLEFMGDF